MHPLEGPLELKVYADPAGAPRVRDLVPIFHRWIQTQCLADELLIDVADYSHVCRGPGVLLMGRDARYGFDESDARPGLTVRRNRGHGEGGQRRLRDAFVRSFRAASFLAEEPALAGAIRFPRTELRLRIHDRLLAPARDDAYATVTQELGFFLGELFDDEVRLVPGAPAHEPFTIRIEFPKSVDVSKALDYLGNSAKGRK